MSDTRERRDDHTPGNVVLQSPMTPSTRLLNYSTGVPSHGTGQPATPDSHLMPPPSNRPGLHSVGAILPSAGSVGYHSSPATPHSVPSPAMFTAESQGIVPVLQNIVSTVTLGCKLDLKKIALSARNAEYNPKVCYTSPTTFSLTRLACLHFWL